MSVRHRFLRFLFRFGPAGAALCGLLVYPAYVAGPLLARPGLRGLLQAVPAFVAGPLGWLPTWALASIPIFTRVLCRGRIGTITAEESTQTLGPALLRIR